MGMRSGDVGSNTTTNTAASARSGGGNSGSGSSINSNSPFGRFVAPLRDVCYLAIGQLRDIKSGLLIKLKTLAKVRCGG